MEVYVQNVRDKSKFTVLLQPDSTVLDLKNALGDKYGVPSSGIKLIFNSLLLRDDTQLVIDIDFEEELPIGCYVQTATKKEPNNTNQSMQHTQQQQSPKTTEIEIDQPKLQPSPQVAQCPIQLPQPQISIQYPQSQIQMQYPQSQIPMQYPQAQPTLTLTQIDPEYQKQIEQQHIAIMNQYVKQMYGPNAKTKIVGKQGDKFVVSVSFDHPGNVTSQKELDNLSQNLMQIYNEMEPEDKNKVDMLKEIGVELIDAIYVYVNNDNYDLARNECMKIKQQLDLYKMYGFNY